MIPGTTLISEPVPRRPVLAVEQLENQGGERVNASVAGADQRHPPALRGEIKREANPRFLLRQRRLMPSLTDDQVGDQVKVKAVTHDIRGGVKRSYQFGGTPLGATGANADDAEFAAAAADGDSIDVASGAGNSAGGATRTGLFNDQHRIRPRSGERRPLGDTVTADLAEDDIGRVGEPRRLGLQFGGGEEAGRHAQGVGKRVHRRLVRLQVERDDAGDGGFRQAVFGEGIPCQIDQLVGRAAALAADAQRQDGRVQDQSRGIDSEQRRRDR